MALLGRYCGRCYSWLSWRCPYLFDCRVTCSFSCDRSLRCKIFSILRCSCCAIGLFRRWLLLLCSIDLFVLGWFRMLRLFDNTQSVSCYPNCWHFYVRREWGFARAWFGPSRNISIALFGTYIYLFFNLIIYYPIIQTLYSIEIYQLNHLKFKI